MSTQDLNVAPENDKRLQCQSLAKQLLQYINPGDTMHSYWDLIFDLKAFANNKPEEVFLKDKDVDWHIAKAEETIKHAEVKGLENVGKTKVIEKRSVLCPLNTYSKEELKNWLIQNAQEPGWMLDPYLGALHSVQYEGDLRRLNYTVYKYVANTPTDETGS